jgi:hypothetical protein
VVAAQALGHAGGLPGVHGDVRAARAVRGVGDEAAPPSLRQQQVSQVVLRGQQRPTPVTTFPISTDPFRRHSEETRDQPQRSVRRGPTRAGGCDETRRQTSGPPRPSGTVAAVDTFSIQRSSCLFQRRTESCLCRGDGSRRADGPEGGLGVALWLVWECGVSEELAVRRVADRAFQPRAALPSLSFLRLACGGSARGLGCRVRFG